MLCTTVVHSGMHTNVSSSYIFIYIYSLYICASLFRQNILCVFFLSLEFLLLNFLVLLYLVILCRVGH